MKKSQVINELEAQKDDLQRKLMEVEAQLAHRASYACEELDGASMERMMASAVILRLNALGGREIVKPVAIRGGLSAETIVALKKDLKRSFDLATESKPRESK